MRDRIRFILNRMNERLWIKPLIICILSIAMAFLAGQIDHLATPDYFPRLSAQSLESLLSVLASSMLATATFAVGSMVSAYASASVTATPRSFPLVIADDVSQNALSTFIGAFIFSIVALIALKNGFYASNGLLVLFAITGLVFVLVVITFIRWVDRIARLGRLGSTIDRVETAASAALQRHRLMPHLCAREVPVRRPDDRAVYGQTVAYVQRLDVSVLQKYAEEAKLFITVNALPGFFSSPGNALVFVSAEKGDVPELDISRIEQAFIFGGNRMFEEDPRFGLIVLSEIASKALSPGINDAGTAIDILGTFVRLFVHWQKPLQDGEKKVLQYDRVAVPALDVHDLFDDAFTATARDGAGVIEVAIRLQKALASLDELGDQAMSVAARKHSLLALKRAELALALEEDKKAVRRVALC